MLYERIQHSISLARLNKPIGILLLLWPTLWAVWLASAGKPDRHVLIIFILGVIIMRSAGCIINDFADRKFDAHVTRTCERPLVMKKVSGLWAVILFFILLFLALLLVLQLNRLTITLAFIGAGLAIVYPFFKRFTYLPQVGLGLAFAWGVPMAFAAETNALPWKMWIVYVTAVLWPIIYDTMYAMVDKNDDVKIGVKSTAILFGKYDLFILKILQIIWLSLLVMVGFIFSLHWPYFFSLIVATVLCGYQQALIKQRERSQCFKAFLNNQWIGLSLFLGILFSYYFSGS